MFAEIGTDIELQLPGTAAIIVSFVKRFVRPAIGIQMDIGDDRPALRTAEDDPHSGRRAAVENIEGVGADPDHGETSADSVPQGKRGSGERRELDAAAGDSDVAGSDPAG